MAFLNGNELSVFFISNMFDYINDDDFAILNEDKEFSDDIQSLIDNPWQGLLEDDWS